MAQKTFYLKGKKYNCYVNGVPYYRKSAVISGKQRSFYGDGEKDAQRKIDEAKALEQSGFNYDKRTAKVGETFRYWLFNVKRVDKNLKASSFAKYEQSFRSHVEKYPISKGLIMKLDSLTLQTYITALYEEFEVGTAAIKETVKVWKMFTKWAIDEGYLVKDPCRNLSVPGKREEKKVIEIFEESERKQLLHYMEETNYKYDTLIKLAFATGMRKGELLGLRWEDIDKDVIHVRKSTGMVTHINKEGERKTRREVWDPKTVNSVRDIPLLPSTQKMLADHHLAQKKYMLAKGLPQSEFVFTASNGSLICASNFQRSYETLLEGAGLRYRKFHCIRHSFATEAIRRGVPVKELQLLLGHSDIHTTYIYVHANNRTKKEAVYLIGEMM